jgi:selenide, water dikinase
MEAILRGGYDKVIEAGAVIVGGHSVEDNEPKYGLAVTGLIEIEKMITGIGAKVGDLLVLTKPIGTGIIATAVKGDIIKEKEAHYFIKGMAELNASAADAMMLTGVSACTDITGFSLLGHLHEMLLSSGVGAEIEYEKVPLYKGVKDMAAMGMIPGGAYRNLDYMKPHLRWKGPAEEKDDALLILADPQTSGGLLVALPEDKCNCLFAALEDRGVSGSIIGQITSALPGKIVVK